MLLAKSENSIWMDTLIPDWYTAVVRIHLKHFSTFLFLSNTFKTSPKQEYDVYC